MYHLNDNDNSGKIRFNVNTNQPVHTEAGFVPLFKLAEAATVHSSKLEEIAKDYDKRRAKEILQNQRKVQHRHATEQQAPTVEIDLTEERRDFDWERIAGLWKTNFFILCEAYEDAQKRYAMLFRAYAELSDAVAGPPPAKE